MEYDADEVGVLKMNLIPRNNCELEKLVTLSAELKDATEVKVGDTILM